jgi:hypothetical protein
LKHHHNADTTEHVLEGGGRTLVTRQDNVVFREAKPWTTSIHLLLKHVEDAGFAESPRIAGSGFDERGRETLTHVDGEFVHPGLGVMRLSFRSARYYTGFTTQRSHLFLLWMLSGSRGSCDNSAEKAASLDTVTLPHGTQ